MRKGKRTHSEIAIRDNDIIKLIKKETPIHEIMKKWETSFSTISRICKRENVDVYWGAKHPGNNGRNSCFLILAELMRKDSTLEEIAKKMNKKINRIKQVLRAAKKCEMPYLEHR